MLAHYPFLAPVKDVYWVPVLRHFHFWAGVDVFFAISGYVVTRTILDLRSASPAQQTDTVARFWIRRFFRLIPMAWLTLLVSVLLAAFWNDMGAFKTPVGNLTDAFFQSFYMSNWRAYWCTINPSELCGVNVHFWSLSLEEQFYIVLPLLIVLFRRKFWWIAVALIIVQFPLDRPLFSFFWVTRLDALLWGVLIAVAENAGVLNKFRPTFMKSATIRRVVLASTLFLICWLVAGGVNRYSIGLVAVLSALLVWLCSYQSGYLFRRTDTFWRTIAWVGSRSYGIYLLHAFCFLAIYEAFYRWYGSKEALGDMQAVLILIIGFAFTLVTCQLAYRYFEKPITDFGRRKAKEINLPFKRQPTQAPATL